MLHASDLIIGSLREYFPDIDSTQKYLINKLNDCKLNEGHLIYADYQTSGIGQSDAKWQSEKGVNLLFSFVLYPHFLKPNRIWRLSQMIAVTVVAVLEPYIAFEKIKIKWPNDILINECKVAGILIQNQISGEKIEHSIIGIGINVNQVDFQLISNNRFPPTSLYLETKSFIDKDRLLNQFCERSNFFYEHLKKSSESYLENLYLESLLNYNKSANYQVADKLLTGVIKGTLPDGRLILKTSDENLYLQPKEIKYL